MNKKFITAAALAASLGAVTSVQAQKAEKVKVVHNGKVIEVSEKAVKAHLAHGDELFVENVAPAPAPPSYDVYIWVEGVGYVVDPTIAPPPSYPAPTAAPAPPSYPAPAPAPTAAPGPAPAPSSSLYPGYILENGTYVVDPNY